MKKKLLIIPTILLAASLTACNLSFIDKYLGVEEEEEESETISSSQTSDTSSTTTSIDDNILVSSIELSEDEISILEGETQTLTATVLPSNAKNKSLEWSSDDETIAIVDNNGVVTALLAGETNVRVVSKDGSNRTAICRVIVTELSDKAIVKASAKYNCYDLSSEYISKYVPATGEQKVLVIPTYFDGDATKATEANRQFIQKSFFGTNDECGWRSFVGYYEEASYGQLHYSGKVADTWYHAEFTTDYVRTHNDSSKTIASHALKWFKETYPTYDLTDYDADNDGYIDSLYIIYATDYEQDTNLWGYRWTTTVNAGDSGLQASAFSWFSLKFLTSTTDYGGVPADGSNTRIIIHEHGHMLGLQDYYDTSYSGMDLIGGWDMQDRNVFDWNSFSKYSVGWTQPYYIKENKLKAKGSETITISAASLNGDCILVHDSSWNGSPFDEYLLLELFNPEIGNNAYDYAHNNSVGIQQTGYGVRMYHVDARMVHYYLDSSFNVHVEQVDEVDPNFTFIPNDNTEVNATEHNYYGKYFDFHDWEQYHLLQMIQKGNVNTFETTDDLQRHTWIQDDLFQTGDSFCLGEHAGYTNYGDNFFYHHTTLNDGTELPYGIEFLNVTKDSATIKFTYLGD